MLNILGIDPSLTHTACWHGIGHASALERRSFSVQTTARQYPHAAARLRAIRNALAFELDACARELAPGHVFIEGYAYGAKCSREALGELGGVLRLLAYERGWSIVVVPPSTLKAYVTGKGSAPKEQVILHVYKRWGYSASDNNDADARALLELGAEYLGTREGLSQERRKLLAKLEPWATLAA